jgi:hypothetical protein
LLLTTNGLNGRTEVIGFALTRHVDETLEQRLKFRMRNQDFQNILFPFTTIHRLLIIVRNWNTEPGSASWILCGKHYNFNAHFRNHKVSSFDLLPMLIIHSPLQRRMHVSLFSSNVQTE